MGSEMCIRDRLLSSAAGLKFLHSTRQPDLISPRECVELATGNGESSRLMLNQLLAGGLVSILNFGVHALMTGIVIVITRHIAGATDDLHVFMRVSALMLVTVTVLTVTHVIEIAIWASFLHVAGISAEHVSVFEFAFENYTALGYGDVVAADGWRLIGPIMALNGLLLIGWSVAIIFEVMRMAEVGFSKRR